MHTIADSSNGVIKVTLSRTISIVRKHLTDKKRGHASIDMIHFCTIKHDNIHRPLQKFLESKTSALCEWQTQNALSTSRAQLQMTEEKPTTATSTVDHLGRVVEN